VLACGGAARRGAARLLRPRLQVRNARSPEAAQGPCLSNSVGSPRQTCPPQRLSGVLAPMPLQCTHLPAPQQLGSAARGTATQVSSARQTTQRTRGLRLQQFCNRPYATPFPSGPASAVRGEAGRGGHQALYHSSTMAGTVHASSVGAQLAPRASALHARPGLHTCRHALRPGCRHAGARCASRRAAALVCAATAEYQRARASKCALPLVLLVHLGHVCLRQGD